MVKLGIGKLIYYDTIRRDYLGYRNKSIIIVRILFLVNITKIS